MRYEAKHSYFKKLAQNVGNFINIPWTLATRHQLWQCYQWLNKDTLPHDEPEIGPGKCTSYGTSMLFTPVLLEIDFKI